MELNLLALLFCCLAFLELERIHVGTSMNHPLLTVVGDIKLLYIHQKECISYSWKPQSEFLQISGNTLYWERVTFNKDHMNSLQSRDGIYCDLRYSPWLQSFSATLGCFNALQRFPSENPPQVWHLWRRTTKWSLITYAANNGSWRY